MIYAYIRVSTDKQDSARQRRDCAALAAKKSQTIETWIEDTASGGTPWSQRALGQWLDTAQTGDVLYITEVSRIARSLVGILTLMAAAHERGIAIHCAQPEITLDGSISSQVLAFAFGIAAQIERDLLRSRTRSALAARRAAGVVLGRPVGSTGRSKLDQHADAIRAMVEAKVSDAAIGRTFKASRHTVSAWINRNITKGEQDA